MTVKEESEKAGLKLNIQKTKIMASSPITSWQINGERVEKVADRQHIKRQGYLFANKGPYSQSYGVARSQVWMWELDHK